MDKKKDWRDLDTKDFPEIAYIEWWDALSDCGWEDAVKPNIHPVLSVGFEKNEEDDGTLLRCLVGPSQGVWAMFMLVYGAVGMLVLFGMFYGGTKYQLENDSTYLWSLPIAFVMFFIVFFGAKFGQKKGHHQMDELIKFLFKCLNKGKIKNWD